MKLTKAESLLCEVEMRYKHGRQPLMKESQKIESSKDAAELLRQYFESEGHLLTEIEYFCVMHLRRNNTLKGMQTIAIGGQSGCVADPKVIFRSALLMGSAAIILCHNHPSGQLHPSTQDKDITNKIKLAGSFLDISVHDHIILTPLGNYFSFADDGQL